MKHVTCHGSGEEHAALFVEQRNVQGSSPEIDHQHIEHVHLVKAVRHGCSRGLVDHAQDLQACKTVTRESACTVNSKQDICHHVKIISKLTGEVGGSDCVVPLSLVKLGGHWDDGFLDGHAQLLLGHLLHLQQQPGADELWAHREGSVGGDYKLGTSIVVNHLKERQRGWGVEARMERLQRHIILILLTFWKSIS